MSERLYVLGGYKMPMSFSAFWIIVSVTAENMNRMFDESMACVMLG